jgi:hypothetical protein
MNRKAILAAVGAVIALILIAVAGYQLGWWLREDSVKRQVRIDNSSRGTQSAWHDQALQGVKDYSLVDPNNTAARGALRTQTCELIARLSEPYRDDIIVTFQQKECK